jgi:hypothetical protein
MNLPGVCAKLSFDGSSLGYGSKAVPRIRLGNHRVEIV